MLFNSFEFLFIFLPITVLIFYRIGAVGHHQIAVSWLVSASLFFYGWWNPAYLGLIIASTFFNYGVGVLLGAKEGQNAANQRWLLAFGVAVNLSLLAYFKYANFFVNNINAFFSSSLNLEPIVLPLAISFFTFQQIAFLVDAYKGETREYNFLHYCLFVTFFPQLIAGPIVHHKEILPQFSKESIYLFDYKRLSIGVSIIIIGLFKKVVIADGAAVYADPIFAAATDGQAISFLEAWGGSLAYTVQLYFDFSGYVDIATGAARIFGIKLPLNFYSPYKATNIIDFWRRWHMTLSRFLRDYLYIPLGGSRKGASRRYVNLMITMLLGGLWHGAGWTFVFWGFLHGFYLIVNHGWRALSEKAGLGQGSSSRVPALCAWFLTFIAVVVAWVFFRAESFSAASNLVLAMFGKGFSSLPDSLDGRLGGLEGRLVGLGFTFDKKIIIDLGAWMTGAPLILFGLLVAFFVPNSNQLFEDERADGLIAWRASFAWALIISAMFMMSMLYLFRVSPFLYFNF